MSPQSPVENRLPAHWPLRETSQFVVAGGWRWHLQRLGADAAEAPWLLLLHGTGGSTHEWADVARSLAPRAHVLLCDLPGHGFTTPVQSGRVSAAGEAANASANADASLSADDAAQAQTNDAPNASDYSLIGMAAALRALLVQVMASHAAAAMLPEPPRLYVAGHSAGAAVALQLAWMAATEAKEAEPADNTVRGQSTVLSRLAGVVGVNPALVPPPAAMVHGILPWLAPLTSSPVTRDVVQAAQRGLSRVPLLGAMQEALGQVALTAILDSTGSPLTEASRQAYRTLFAEPRHVWCAMQMMAHWGLAALMPRLADLSCPVTLLVARDDPWIPVRALEALHREHPAWTWCETTGGHLLPETSPALVARVIAEQCFRTNQ